MIQPEDLHEIKTKMAGLCGREAKRVADVLAQEIGVDITRIYHYSKDVRPKRSRRSDRGELRAFSEETFREMAYYTVNGDFAGTHLARIAKGNGKGDIAPATFNRVLRQRGLSRAQNKVDLKPYRSWQAKAPNHIHQIDSTVAQQFYLDDDGSVGFESIRDRNKNKKGNRKPRLTLLSLVDDFSRVGYAQFFLSDSKHAWMEFLYRAWSVKSDPVYFPFHGMPAILYGDQGCQITSKVFRRAMQQLGVHIVTHKPYSPRSKGKVENRFKFIQEFEKVTKFGGWTSLDEANAALWDWLIYANNRKHGTTSERPFERWQNNEKQRFVTPPNEELFELLHLEPAVRQIRKNYTISLNGKTWLLPRRKPFADYIGQMVEIFYYPDERTQKLYMILDDKEYEVEYQPDVMLFGKQPDDLPIPAALERRQALENAEDPGLKLYGFYKDQYGRPYMGRKAEQIDGSRIQPDLQKEVMRTMHWFTKLLQQQFLIDTPPTAEQLTWLDNVFSGERERPEAWLRQRLAEVADGRLLEKKSAAGGV